MTSVCGILIAAQQLSLLALLGELPADPHAPSAKHMERQLSQLLAHSLVQLRPTTNSEIGTTEQQRKWQLSWKMIFTWQCPIMFIGYSTLFYFVGLSVVVCSPLISGEDWGPGVWVSLPITRAWKHELISLDCNDILYSLRDVMGSVRILLLGWISGDLS